jgi:hypothetical protein
MIKIELGNYDPKYAKGLIEREKHEEIIRALVRLLKTKDRQAYPDTCSLIRDLVLGPFESSKNKVFNRLIDKSRVISVLENNVLAGNYFQRSSSIYTLGKICSKQSVPAMTRSLVKLALRDPINASDLVSEIWWLDGSGKKNWDLIEKLSALGFYQKWGALHVLSHWSGRGEFGKRRIERIKRFAEEADPLIRIEALYLLEESKIKRKPIGEELSSPSMPPWEPIVVFENLRLEMGNMLYTKGRNDFTIGDLDDLLQAKLKRPQRLS